MCGHAAAYARHIHDEHTGYSDGVVFYESCASSTGIGYLAQTALLTLDNHLQLGWESGAMAQVEAWLR